MSSNDKQVLVDNEFFEPLGFKGDSYFVLNKRFNSVFKLTGRLTQFMLNQIAPQSWWRNDATQVADHAYLQRKHVQAYGVRVSTWEFVDEETGEVSEVPDTLFVPIYRKVNGKSELCSIEGILPSGKKYGFKGGRKVGGYHVIGTPKTIDGRELFMVAEGYSTAASLHEASGHCVVIAFTAGNLPAIAKQIRAGKRDALIMICADDDFTNTINVGVDKANEAARAVAGHVVVPAFREQDGKNTNDWNDLSTREGGDVVLAQINAAIGEAVMRTVGHSIRQPT
jgi:putative DNA primase/helicase